MIPLACWAKEAAFGCGDSIGTTMCLARIEVLVFRMTVIENLQFSHCDISSIVRTFIFWHLVDFRLARVSHDQTVIPARWQLEINSHNVVAVGFFAEECSAFAGLALDTAVDDRVIIGCTLPTC